MPARHLGISIALAVALLLPATRTVIAEDAKAAKPAPKGSLSVVGIEAGTGRRLPTVYFTLVDSMGRVVARDCENRYEGATAPEVGDEVFVFAPGHDLQRVRLTKEQMHLAQVELKPTAAQVRLLSKVGPGVEDRLHAIVKHYLRAPGGGDEMLLFHRYEVRIGKTGAEVEVPRGLKTVVFPRGAITDHVYPLVFSPRGGETVAIRADRMRQVPIKLGSGDDGPGLKGARAFPSYTLPSGWPPARVDALLRRLWGGLTVMWRDGRLVVNQVPPIDFYLLGRINDEPIYRFVDAGTKEIDLTWWDRPVSIKEVTVAGKVVPSGSVVAPGRLGHNSVARLASFGPDHLVRIGDTDRGAGRIAAARTYTIWNPTRGFAFASITGSRLSASDWQAGTIALRSRTGAPLSGRCAIWQTLVGTGAMGGQPPQTLRWDPGDDKRSGFVEVVWEREGKDVETLRFVGVPPGKYRMNYAVTNARTGKAYRVVNSTSCPRIEVSADEPHPVVLFD